MRGQYLKEKREKREKLYKEITSEIPVQCAEYISSWKCVLSLRILQASNRGSTVLSDPMLKRDWSFVSFWKFIARRQRINPCLCSYNLAVAEF